MQEIQRERTEDSMSQEATQLASAVLGESVTGESVTGEPVTGESSLGEPSTSRRQTLSQSKPSTFSTPTPEDSTVQRQSAPEIETSSNQCRPKTWTHCSHVPVNERIAELSDTHLGKALAHHRFQMELAPEWQSDDLYEGDNARFPSETITMVAR
eukprot:3140982-Rhodomonas_salina.1